MNPVFPLCASFSGVIELLIEDSVSLLVISLGRTPLKAAFLIGILKIPSSVAIINHTMYVLHGTSACIGLLVFSGPFSSPPPRRASVLGSNLEDYL